MLGRTECCSNSLDSIHFCDECGKVSSPTQRREARLEANRVAALTRYRGLP